MPTGEGFESKAKFMPGETGAFNIKELLISLKGNKFYDQLYSHFTNLHTADAGRDFNSFLTEYKTSLVETEARLNENDFDETDRPDLEQDKRDLEQAVAWLAGILGMFGKI